MEKIDETDEIIFNRHNLNCEIAYQRLKLIHLNIQKVMADLKEDPDNYKLQYENGRLLQDLMGDIGDLVNFFHSELIRK
jgi:hypothetical protein